jgi:hypothetical protein
MLGDTLRVELNPFGVQVVTVCLSSSFLELMKGSHIPGRHRNCQHNIFRESIKALGSTRGYRTVI